MDRVRLGRVLGRGARLAAKTAYDAVDAATAPSPAGASPRQSLPAQPPAETSRTRTPISAGTVLPRIQQGARAARASKRGMFAPVKRATRAVSLEVTGSFFIIFALSFAVGLWHMRFTLYASGGGVYKFAAGCLLVVLFLYFAVSNFIQAKRLP